MTQLRIDVNLGPRSYPIFVGAGLLSQAPDFILPLGKLTHLVVISDSNVAPLYMEPFCRSFERQGVRVDRLIVPAGETSKSVQWAEQIWNALLDFSADRKSAVAALGGGVVGDLAGFAAATFARGIRLIQVPTSLLAQVDSSVGGKVGINLGKAKNMVGAFHQPAAVVIDVHTLKSLPTREYLSGLAEVVKYGVIMDPEFFNYLEQNVSPILNQEAQVLTHVVARCCRLKADIVEQDEREESGLRAILNYGHTFAHAFETLTGYSALLHGEAVAMGMTCAGRLAVQRELFSAESFQRQTALLQAFGLPVAAPHLSPDAVLECMRHDKKVQHGQLRLVLPKRIGEVLLFDDIRPEEIRGVLAAQ